MSAFRFTMLAAALLAALAGCSRSAGTAHTAGRNAWTQPGVLRLGEPDEPDSINPLFGHTAATDEVDAMLFSYLLRYDADGNFIPDLALAVPTYGNAGISKDGKTIVFHLRKARWSDGTPLTSADWMFTYHAVENPRNNTKSLVNWTDIAWAQTPDAQTIIVHLKQPNATIMGIFAMGSYPPLPAHVLGTLPDINHAPFNQHPISSGPYVLREWNHGAWLSFVPNQVYFRGAPALKEVLWKVIPDTNTLFTQLRTHEIDVYSGVDQVHIPQLANISGITVSHRLIANWRHLGINMSRPILSDLRVRQAIAQGVDWKRINDKSYRGINQLAVSDIFPQSWAAPAIPPYAYDPTRAAALLEQAGWTPGADGVRHKNGQPLHLMISTSTNNQPNAQAEIQIQSDLRPLGVQLEIRNYPVNLLFAQDGPLYSGKYDLEWTVDTNAPDPDNAGLWNSTFIPPHGANTSWLRDAIVDRTSSAALQTFDRARRKALYQQEEARIHRLVPAVFFYWENSYAAVNTDVHGYVPAAFIADMWNCWDWRV
ncbi:MAG TPA: peptide ABC transporter substrate-binding protein [Candidatus Baltobacteraceae bacterium]|jgi:peptide/nickel transport system substrate-binding protein|nr:peptide ABC transporter substrate-binding protein [Candidatus Baltobacteraceae bacterium]